MSYSDMIGQDGFAKQIEFVKQNIKILTGTTYDKDRLKKLRKEFFVDINKGRFGKPLDKEIAHIVIIYLRKNGFLKSAEQAKQFILDVPFLKSNIFDVDDLPELFNEDKQESVLTLQDLTNLNQKDFLLKKEGEIKAKVIKENVEDIDKALEEKRKEYDAIPSVLDSTDFPEPEEEKKS